MTLSRPRGALWTAFTRLWTWVRAVSGDSAYEDYRRRPRTEPMSPEAFYLDTLRRKYTGPNRCC